MRKRKTAFLIRPFQENFTENYKNYIVPKLNSRLNIRLKDAQNYSHETINEKVKNAIKNSELIICDISKKNENVLWELGYADGLNKPLVLLRNKRYPKRSSAVTISNLIGTCYIEYNCKKNVTFFNDTLESDINDEIIRKSESQKFNKLSHSEFINAFKYEWNLIYIGINELTKSLLVKLPLNKKVIHCFIEATFEDDKIKNYLSKRDNILLTPIQLFCDFLFINKDKMMLGFLTNNTYWIIKDKSLEIILNYLKDFFMSNSIYVSTGYSLEKIVEHSEKICKTELESLKKYGIGFFEKSQFWFEKPQVILESWLNDIETKIQEKQVNINTSFYHFSQEMMVEDHINNIYTLWPLLNEESLDLVEDKSVINWLEQLNGWKKKNDAHNVTRFLVINGSIKDGNYEFEGGSYKEKLKKIINTYFTTDNCSYTNNIRLITKNDDTIDYFFSKRKCKLILSENSILFLNKNINEDLNDNTTWGYIQREEKIKVEFNDTYRNLLVFRYINMLEEKNEFKRDYIEGFRRLIAKSNDSNSFSVAKFLEQL